MPIQSRRRFLTSAAFAGAAGLGGFRPWGKALAAEPPPEITTIRFTKHPAMCEAPLFVALELLQTEGFTDVSYIKIEPSKASIPMIARGELDFALHFVTSPIIGADAGLSLTILGGVHTGCFELFTKEDIHRVADLKGRIVGTQALGTTIELVTLMTSYVGLDPAKDVRWVTNSAVKSMQLFLEGKIDAFLATPPESQELRARNNGHVLVNSAIDRPWSEYFCCVLVGNTEFVRKYPFATKRVLRAILKATDFCANEPQKTADRMIAAGFADNYDYAIQMLKEIPYGSWRDYDPEDAVRWYVLRLNEAGFIKSTPPKLIAEHTDWRFLNELKRELKA
jgi:NitT/TauT family transport system substrate-binding protein